VGLEAFPNTNKVLLLVEPIRHGNVTLVTQVSFRNHIPATPPPPPPPFPTTVGFVEK